MTFALCLLALLSASLAIVAVLALGLIVNQERQIRRMGRRMRQRDRTAKGMREMRAALREAAELEHEVDDAVREHMRLKRRMEVSTGAVAGVN